MARLRIVTLLSALAIVAAGCAGDTETTAPPAPGGGQVEEPAGEAGTSEAPAAGETESGDTEAEGSEAEGSEAAGGGEAVTIGALHPLTGPLALDGGQMSAAAQLAVDDINAAGGIAALDGAQLELATADTQGQPEVGQSEAQRMVDEGAVALIGTFQSAVTTNVATVAERSQVPLVIDVAVDDEILQQGGSYAFRIQPNATAMGQAGARYLQEVSTAADTPVETVAYLYEETNFGTSVSSAFAEEATALGIEVVFESSYNAFEVADLTTELAQVAAAAPDALVVTGYYNDGILLAENARDVAPDIDVVFGVAQGAYDLPQFPVDVPDASEGLFDANYHFDATSERTQEVRDAFAEETGDEMRTAAVLSYQAVELIADALERSGEAEPTAVRDALAETSFADPLLAFPGPIEFDDNGENVNGVPILMQVQEAAVAQVYPEEFAEAEPIYPTVPWGPGAEG